jgi:hypothetical protein
MTWLCIPSIYSQVPGEGSWQINSLDTLQSALSKSKTIPDEFCCKDNLTGFFQSFLFGTMLKRSGSTIPNVLASLPEQRRYLGNSSFVAGSLDPARTSAPPARAPGSTVPVLAFGASLPGSLARFDLDSYSWRTPQISFLEGLDEFSETWPRWGSIRNGVCWARTMSVLHTSGSESGSWPTPTSNPDAKNTGANRKCGPNSLTEFVLETMRMFPTPTATNTKANHMRGSDKGKLRESRSYLPTPTARDWKSGEGRQEDNGNTPQLPEVIGGQLNPRWVELLMGWPQEWTNINPMSVIEFQSWCDGFGTNPGRPEELPALPRLFAYYGPHAWQDGSWENAVPRVAQKVVRRVDRLKAIGNGQVPAVAALAFATLYRRLIEN